MAVRGDCSPSAAGGSPIVLPKFMGAESSSPMSTLKSRCQDAKPLGLVRCLNDEILVVYDGASRFVLPLSLSPRLLIPRAEVGCYIDKHGVPCRSAGYLRWESKADVFVHRGEHILLFSSGFIEVRTVQTGKLVQVIEAGEVRLAYRGLLPADATMLVACSGRVERGVVTERIVELVETSEITTPRASAVSAVPGMWDDWDM